jgi:protein phosphatase 2C family protein 2/3
LSIPDFGDHFVSVLSLFLYHQVSIMGQTLSSPATQKFSESGANERLLYAVSEMQGWRITMEDAHAAILDLDENKNESNTFFAVYDGHGGGSVAKFAGQNVHKRLVNEEAYHDKNYKVAMKRAFLGTDEDILADPGHTRDPSGCTAVAALVTHDGKIYVANAGDSRSVLSVQGEVEPLSFDHKPANDVEKARIHGAGGYIEFGRVNGNLALSRALGDFDFKKNYSLTPEQQIITADPDVSVHEITCEDEFLVIACDGIWDCLSSQQVVNFIRLNISEGKELTDIAEMMCEHCLAPDTSSGAGIGCDNMTVLIVAILHGRTKEEWYSWITDRVKQGYGYKTPQVIPQIYAQSRLASFRVRRDAQEARERDRARRSQEDSNAVGSLSSPITGVTQFLGLSGGISFDSSTGTLNDGLMFGHDDSDDDDSGDDIEDGDGRRSLFGSSLGLASPDLTFALRAQLEDFESDDTDDGQESNPSHDNASLPPKPLSNGDVTPVNQLKYQPGSDQPSPAVKAEGLLDKSEDPLVG